MKNMRKDVLGVVVVGGFVTVCILVLSGGIIDVSMKDVGMVLIGALGAKFSTIVDYHYGSSAGSAAKDQIAAEKKEGKP